MPLVQSKKRAELQDMYKTYRSINIHKNVHIKYSANL